MVKIMENPIKMDDLGVLYPYFWKHPYGVSARVFFSENTYFILVESRYNGAWEREREIGIMVSQWTINMEPKN